MKKYQYHPIGTCSSLIEYWIEGDIIQKVKITGGCPGNTVGVSKLVEGKQIDKVIELLLDTPCRDRGTSCPDQLAKGLIKIKNNELKDVK